MEDQDIWRLAARLIRMFDDGAEMASAMYGDKALAQGDLARVRKWSRVTAAIHALQRANPGVRKAMN